MSWYNTASCNRRCALSGVCPGDRGQGRASAGPHTHTHAHSVRQVLTAPGVPSDLVRLY